MYKKCHRHEYKTLTLTMKVDEYPLSTNPVVLIKAKEQLKTIKTLANV